MGIDSVVQEALKYTEMEREYRNDKGENTVGNDFEDFGLPQIKIVGCGGAGNNTINRLYNIGVNGAETIAVNTDKQHLDVIKADKKILVGKSLTRGLGAGGFPEIGKRAAELARSTLQEVLKDADLVFITAGMGGGTGTGTAPIVAQVAKEQGAIVVGMVSTPFKVERARMVKAEEGIADLRSAADTVIVLDNNRLLEYVPNLPLEQSFSVMDQLISETVKGISETITRPSLINLDFADVRAIMNAGGVAVMLVGETKSQDKSDNVVRNALNHPLLDVDYRGATGALVHITGGPDLTLREAENIAESLTYELDSHANVIWGARVQKDYEGKVRVLAIMTGVQSPQIMGKNAKGSAMASDEMPAGRIPMRGNNAKASKSIIDVIK
ncbi:cell division protein FtsZ homolog [Methanocella paludicola SANAE]|uniref:Cell division protein FtsZ n=1 Tax=Methanocella paludicola (strain DSM 17711 / JCM 13418 / NBRC 101707 / SANAE) TaxID=304371 RepID=D1YZG3_METPS|nr:cell division protein FtsZ [Methanocella paludicola]BAI61835.1 cell division protein FtsZ homolog [Methanocella paludicola SANAE]